MPPRRHTYTHARAHTHTVTHTYTHNAQSTERQVRTLHISSCNAGLSFMAGAPCSPFSWQLWRTRAASQACRCRCSLPDQTYPAPPSTYPARGTRHVRTGSMLRVDVRALGEQAAASACRPYLEPVRAHTLWEALRYAADEPCCVLYLPEGQRGHSHLLVDDPPCENRRRSQGNTGWTPLGLYRLGCAFVRPADGSAADLHSSSPSCDLPRSKTAVP